MRRQIVPTNQALLATAVADSIVMAVDADAKVASIYYWEKARSWTTQVVEAALSSDNPRLAQLGMALADRPDDQIPYRDLIDYLLSADRGETDVAELLELGWHAECNSRMGYHLGADYRRRDHAEPDPSPDENHLLNLGAQVPAPPAPDGSRLSDYRPPPVLIVIPFRDTSPSHYRLRNLQSCLLALRDQSLPSHRYRVTVVETDTEQRWRHVIEPLVDTYVHAYKNGPFNRSWGMNVGVSSNPTQPEVICLMDADMLVDHRFLERNVDRFLLPGAQGHLPYGNVLCLDKVSTNLVIEQRIEGGRPDVSPRRLRGFTLRRPTGGCAWVRYEAFSRIGGMDERYEGWGGEDNDFAYRFDRFSAPLDRYQETIYHLHHPGPAHLVDGEVVTIDVPAMSWQPTTPIGDPHRFDPVAARPVAGPVG